MPDHIVGALLMLGGLTWLVAGTRRPAWMRLRFWVADAADNPGLAAAENEWDDRRLDARTLAAGDEFRAHLADIDTQVAAFRRRIEAFERGRWVR